MNKKQRKEVIEIVGKEIRNRLFGFISSLILLTITVIFFRIVNNFEPSEVFSIIELMGSAAGGLILVGSLVTGVTLFIITFTKLGFNFEK